MRTPIAYLELTMLIPMVGYAGAITHVKGIRGLRAAARPSAFVAGIATFVAYACVLAALERAPAASVAAVRETSVVIATALSAFVLKEHVTRWRFVGACVVVAASRCSRSVRPPGDRAQRVGAGGAASARRCCRSPGRSSR